MRITGGTLRGQKLTRFTDVRIKPAADYIRKAIFDIIVHRFSNINISRSFVIDVFSGTGALGIEALSRGALHVTFVDKSKLAKKLIYSNIKSLGLEDKSTILTLDLETTQCLPIIQPCILAFLDPPYVLNRSIVSNTLMTLRNNRCLQDEALCIIKHSKEEQLKTPTCFNLIEYRECGRTSVSFFLFRSLYPY